MKLYSGVLIRIGFVDESVVTVVRGALDCFKLNDNDVMYKAGKVFTGSSGRPRYNISRKKRKISK